MCLTRDEDETSRETWACGGPWTGFGGPPFLCEGCLLAQGRGEAEGTGTLGGTWGGGEALAETTHFLTFHSKVIRMGI